MKNNHLLHGGFNSLTRYKDFFIEGVNITKRDEGKTMHVGLPIREKNILMVSDS